FTLTTSAFFLALLRRSPLAVKISLATLSSGNFWPKFRLLHWSTSPSPLLLHPLLSNPGPSHKQVPAILIFLNGITTAT
ncbi:Uncharacterized protein APZ42_006976, partial [Daphnia magna]